MSVTPLPGGPRILVVEDEVFIRQFVKAALVEAGFHVLEVEPEEALETLSAQGAAIRGLVTDINLGSDLSGWEIATRARLLHPSMPVVYMSGNAAGDWPALGVPDSLMLQKPFAAGQVAAAVSELLNKTHT